jgi:hypothetical protein
MKIDEIIEKFNQKFHNSNFHARKKRSLVVNFTTEPILEWGIVLEHNGDEIAYVNTKDKEVTLFPTYYPNAEQFYLTFEEVDMLQSLIKLIEREE